MTYVTNKPKILKLLGEAYRYEDFLEQALLGTAGRMVEDAQKFGETAQSLDFILASIESLTTVTINHQVLLKELIVELEGREA